MSEMHRVVAGTYTDPYKMVKAAGYRHVAVHPFDESSKRESEVGLLALYERIHLLSLNECLVPSSIIS